MRVILTDADICFAASDEGQSLLAKARRHHEALRSYLRCDTTPWTDEMEAEATQILLKLRTRAAIIRGTAAAANISHRVPATPSGWQIGPVV
jgi:hypothetical protein